MPKFFDTMDRVRPVYDWVYKVIMVVCKLLLIADISASRPFLLSA